MSCPHLTAQNIRSNLLGVLIYKDECMRCFASPTDQGGINVCLKTFQGFCTSQGLNHTALHYNRTHNPIMLNLRNVPKEVVEEKPREITKLAIGKEGGAAGDQPEFDVVSKLICVECDVELDKTNPLVAGVIDSVILSKSAYFESQVGEWELDLKVCPHTENLIQEEVQALESKALAHC